MVLSPNVNSMTGYCFEPSLIKFITITDLTLSVISNYRNKDGLNSVQVRKGIQPDALVIMPKHEDQAVMVPIIFYIPMPITEAP